MFSELSWGFGIPRRSPLGMEGEAGIAGEGARFFDRINKMTGFTGWECGIEVADS